jgi:hypothetical protein
MAIRNSALLEGDIKFSLVPRYQVSEIRQLYSLLLVLGDTIKGKILKKGSGVIS